MTEPTDRRAFSVPRRFSSPKMPVSFESVRVAPSPRSSRATLILSAARTKPSTSSCDCFPSRPASWARRFRSSREDRGSIFLNSSFSFSTSSADIPVNLRTFAISCSMSAYAWTADFPAMTKPVTAAPKPTSAVWQSLSQRLKRDHSPCCGCICSLTLPSSSFTALILAICSSHAFEPRSMPFSCDCKVRRALFNSRGVALSRRCMTCSTVAEDDWICCISRLVLRSSLWSFAIVALSPAFAALAIPFSSLSASVSKRRNICCACFPLTERVTVAVLL